VVLVPDALEDEDMLEMLNAGLFQVIIVDDWLARMWAQVLPKIKVHDTAALRTGGKIGWAIRKGSPKLAAELTEFYEKFLRKQGVYAARLKQYYSRIKELKDPKPTRRHEGASMTRSRSSSDTAPSITSTR
jgi:membrane-bound lytic murein transglycosylase MltF